MNVNIIVYKSEHFLFFLFKKVNFTKKFVTKYKTRFFMNLKLFLKLFLNKRRKIKNIAFKLYRNKHNQII